MNFLNKKSFVFVITLTFIFSLISCDSSNNNVVDELFNYSLLTPSGAPTLPLYHEIIVESKVQTTNNPSSIPLEFSNNNYDFLVFDSTKAYNFTKSENSNYEFVRMLTGGNYYLLGFNTLSEYPINGDNIYSFQKDSNFDLVFKNLFGDIISQNNYFDSVDKIQSFLYSLNKNFEINNSKVDWVVISEPQKTNLFNIRKNNDIDTSLIKEISLRKLFKEKNSSLYVFNYLPQAGLYVNKNFKKNNEELYKNIINRIELKLENAIKNINVVLEEISNFSKDDELIEVNTFGFTSETMEEVQENSKNGFAIVPYEEAKEMSQETIESFLNLF